MKSDTVGGKAASSACNTHCLLLVTSLLAYSASACLCQCNNVDKTRGMFATSSISLQHQEKGKH